MQVRDTRKEFLNIDFLLNPMAWKSPQVDVVDTSLYPPGTLRFSLEEDFEDDMDTSDLDASEKKDTPGQTREGASSSSVPFVPKQVLPERKIDSSKDEKETKETQLGSHSQIRKSLTHAKPRAKPYGWNFSFGRLYLIKGTGIYIFKMDFDKKNYYNSNFSNLSKKYDLTQFSSSVYGPYAIVWSIQSENAKLDYEMNTEFYKHDLSCLLPEEKKSIPTLALGAVKGAVTELALHNGGHRGKLAQRLGRLFDYAERVHSLSDDSDITPTCSSTLGRCV